jgi:hypothetical protein
VLYKVLPRTWYYDVRREREGERGRERERKRERESEGERETGRQLHIQHSRWMFYTI